MKITTEARDDHQLKVVAEFETILLEKFKRQAARKIAGKAKIPGFRPGKAPYDVISRLYGEPAIEEEAIELMVEDSYPLILAEAKIEPAAPGSLEDIDKGDPLKFTFVIPLEPTVKLGDYRAIRKEYSPEPVTEKQVDEFVHRLQRTYATAEAVERPAADGDLVSLKVSGTILKPVEGEKAEILADSPLQVVIGEVDSEGEDFPYAGFSNNLKGLSASEEKTFKFTYPKDSKFEKLRSKAVEFHVVIQNVKSLTLPELNEEFAKMFGEYENLQALLDSIKTQIEKRQTADYDQKYFDDLVEKLASEAKIQYPPQVLEHEMEHVIEAVTRDLTEQHMELDAYLKTLNKEKDIWREEDVKPAAVKRLVRSLVMDEFSKQEKIEVSKEDLQSEFVNLIGEMQSSQEIKNLDKQLKSEKVSNAIAMQAANRVFNRNVFSRFKDIATGKTDSAEVIKPKPRVAKSATKKTVKSAEIETPTTIDEPATKPKKGKKQVEDK